MFAQLTFSFYERYTVKAEETLRKRPTANAPVIGRPAPPRWRETRILKNM